MNTSTSVSVSGKTVIWWLKELGVADSPQTRKSVEAALAFYREHMPSLSMHDQFDYFRGIDLHNNVETTHLAPDFPLAAYRFPDKPIYKNFYTKRDTSIMNIGIGPNGRTHYFFRVISSTPALTSRASPISYRPTKGSPAWVYANGGGIQFFIPNAWRCVRRVP